MATRTPKQEAMCCVTLGYQSFLMSADDGMRLVKIMQNAIECQETYRDGPAFVLKEKQPDIEMKLVRPAQIIRDTGNERLAIGDG